MKKVKRSPKVRAVKDQVPEVKVSVPAGKKPALIPLIKDPTLSYNSTKSKGRSQFQLSEYSLAESGRVEDTDSYVRQAFDKKSALMFKEGWDIVGPNPKTIKYIKTRLQQIAIASKVPTRSLLREIGSGLVRKSNVFLIKVRKEEASGGAIRRAPGSKVPLVPVAGYFISPAETMEYQLSGNKVIRWQQNMPNGDKNFYVPRDLIHFFYDRKEGFVFGTPILTPVIDDIRALRKIEENIELLIYQCLFPLFHYIVGTEDQPAAIDENGESEIDVVRREIQYMPAEGGIVTPERHEIKAIGSEGRALKADGYLEHFKKRVFAGLGVSAVDMGEGETANRATADNMSRNLIDSVKDFQQIIEIFFNEYIINELLLESTFGVEVLDEENLCRLKFKEIDIDAQIKKEAHLADQFNKDSITWDELRTTIGYEPIIVPTREEMDSEVDTAQKYPEWHKTRWKLFKEPELLIQSLDEPFSPTAKAVARNQSLEPTSADMDESAEASNKQEIDLEKEKSKAKVAVAKAKPKVGATRPSAPKKVKNGYLASTYDVAAKDIVTKIKADTTLDHDWYAVTFRAQMGTTVARLLADQVLAFHNGYSLHAALDDDKFIRNMAFSRQLFQERAEKYVTRLQEHVIGALRRNVTEDLTKEDKIIKARAVFESAAYRTKFIEDVEVRKARAWGQVMAKRKEDFSLNDTMTVLPTKESTCERCQRHADQDPIHLEWLTLDSVPPFHASCNCAMEFTSPSEKETLPIKNSTNLLQDKTDEEPEDGDITEGEFLSCPKCGKTAIKGKDTIDQYNCRACGHKFKKKVEDNSEAIDTPVEESEGNSESQFLICKNKALARLKERHPDWDDDTIEQIAEAACDYHRQMDKKEMEDEVKLEKCVLKVKKQLKKEHPNWNEDKVKSSAFVICNASQKGD